MSIRHLPTNREEPQPYVYQPWPAVFYGPNGENRIFHSAAEVPAGWLDHPAKHPGHENHVGFHEQHGLPLPAPAAPAAPKPPKAPAAPVPPAPPSATAAASAEVDAAGVAWSPELHAGSKGKTGAGLWRMKVGVKRPEGHSAPLDL